MSLSWIQAQLWSNLFHDREDTLLRQNPFLVHAAGFISCRYDTYECLWCVLTSAQSAALIAEKCENQKARADRDQVQICWRAQLTDCRLTLQHSECPLPSSKWMPRLQMQSRTAFSAWSPSSSCGRRGSAGDCPSDADRVGARGGSTVTAE